MIDALREYATRLRESGAVLASLAPPQPSNEQQPPKRRKRARVEPPTNSSTTNGRKNLNLLPNMPLDILFEVSHHVGT